MRHRSKIKLALLFVLFAGLGALLWGPIQQARSVAAVQDSLESWHVTFQNEEPVEWMSYSVDRAAYRLIDRLGLRTPDRGTEDYHERFRSLLRGPIENIEIYDPVRIRGDLGAALARFPRLRQLRMVDDGYDVTDADWTKLCRSLRQLPGLEELQLSSSNLTDAAIAPLAGHPRLRIFSFRIHRLTPSSLSTFASLPSLKSLYLGSEFDPKETQAFIAALPSVQVEFEK